MSGLKKMVVLIGNYGSGKTELALNFAIQAARRGEKTELLDLDMVNTYFRLTEPGRLTRMKDIRVVQTDAYERYQSSFAKLHQIQRGDTLPAG